MIRSAFYIGTFVASANFAAMTSFAAPCPKPVFTAPDQVKTANDEVLIVTHPSTQWDGRYSSKAGMDAAVQHAKKKAMPVIYLQDSDIDVTNGTYFFSDCNPTYWVASAGGEFNFAVTAQHVYSVGGHWELCQATTQADLMAAWKDKMDGEDLTFTQVMDGLYMYGRDFQSSDPYYEDFTRFMEIIYYDNPRNEWYTRKLNLLEAMGIVKDKAEQVEFLKRNLPPYHIFNGYEVELWLNGKKIEVLQEGTDEKAPVLKLEFVNSLYEGGYIPTLR